MTDDSGPCPIPLIYRINAALQLAAIVESALSESLRRIGEAGALVPIGAAPAWRRGRRRFRYAGEFRPPLAHARVSTHALTATPLSGILKGGG
jgi:hypothetical protein